jgi:ankyrin repeat protein
MTTTIFDAVREGREEQVSSLASADPTLLDEIEESSGDTPLLMAVEHGRLDMVKLLLKEGANVDHKGHKDVYGEGRRETALIRAIRKGEHDMVALLLGNGAKADLADGAGNTPLIWASMQGDMRLVKMVFEAILLKGVSPDLDRSGMHYKRTALHHAAAGGHFDVVAYLLCKEAQVNSQDHYNQTPLMLACQKGHLEVVQLLMLLGAQRGQELEARSSFGFTALHHAACGGNKAVVAFLLSKGAQVISWDEEEPTPLMLACNKGQLEMVQMLVDAREGHGLEERDMWGMTVLHFAARGGNKEVLTFLLGKDAELSSRDQEDMMPLTSVSGESHLEAMQALAMARERQRLEETDTQGRTVLHYAAMGGSRECSSLFKVKAIPNLGREPLRETIRTVPTKS